MVAAARAGISATSVTHIWKIFLYACLFICISHFWLQAFNQQSRERESCRAVGVVAVAQNVWGMVHLVLPATVSQQSSHSDSACQPPSDLLQLMSPSAVATVCQACCACTGHFYGAYLISPSMYWGHLLTVAGHQATWPEAGLYIPGEQSDCFCSLFLCQNKTFQWKRNTVTPSAANRKN